MKNKIIIITGGSGLLGKEICKDIKLKGGIPINFDVSINNMPEIETINCDITSPESIINSVEKVKKKHGRIDGLVNNAYPRTKDWGEIFEEIKIDSWKENVDMQLNSTFVMCQEVLKIMKNQKFGSIINIASIYGVVGNDFGVYEGTKMTTAAAYSAIKGGVINFSRYLASYYGKSGIRINCVSPGGIYDNQPRRFVDNYEKKVPLGRMGKPNDIAPMVSFLLSNESSYITGQNIIIDGGWTAI